VIQKPCGDVVVGEPFADQSYDVAGNIPMHFRGDSRLAPVPRSRQ
jgi:hypothetical protein